MANSPTQPLVDSTQGKFGPFAGQMLIGEMNKPRIIRIITERIGGKIQVPACPFTTGTGFRRETTGWPLIQTEKPSGLPISPRLGGKSRDSEDYLERRSAPGFAFHQSDSQGFFHDLHGSHGQRVDFQSRSLLNQGL